MNLDRDLRDAMKPLRGDPVADAARVLGALPSPDGGGSSATPKGMPPALWWVLAGVLVLGGVAGGAVGYAMRGAAVVSAVLPPKIESPKDETPKEAQPNDTQPKDRPKDPPSGQREMEGYLMLMAFGSVTVNEPRQQQEILEPNQYFVSTGTIFETNEGMAGLYVYANDARVRLAQRTVATVEVDRVILRAGLSWVSTVTRPTAMRVETDLATVLTDAVEMIIERTETHAIVTVLDGSATLRSKSGGSLRLAVMERVMIDAVGVPGAVTAVPFAGTATAWMAKMILLQADASELEDRIAEMAAAFVEGSHRDAAAIELRRLGARPVPTLFKLLDSIVTDVDLVHRTAALIGDLADYPYRDWLSAMLERGDEETRAIAFRAIVRVSGTQVEDESFWRANSAVNREVALRQWREKLR